MTPSKSIFSFIAAFAVATGVIASATPVARDSGCNTGTMSCCNYISYSNDPVVATFVNITDIAIPVDSSIPLGIIRAVAVCCQNVSQNGVVNVGCTPINNGP